MNTYTVKTSKQDIKNLMTTIVHYINVRNTNQPNYSRYKELNPVHWSQSWIFLFRLSQKNCRQSSRTNFSRSNREWWLKWRKLTYKYYFHISHWNVFKMLDIYSTFRFRLCTCSPEELPFLLHVNELYFRIIGETHFLMGNQLKRH